MYVLEKIFNQLDLNSLKFKNLICEIWKRKRKIDKEKKHTKNKKEKQEK